MKNSISHKERCSEGLIMAAKIGDLSLVNRMLAVEEVDVNASINKGFTALMFASGKGYSEIVAILLARE